MAEAYNAAGVKHPRTFKFNTKEENKQIIINFIKENPMTNLLEIREKTKRNPTKLFNGIKKAFQFAGVEYPRIESYGRTAEQKRKEIIRIVKENPNITFNELLSKANMKNFYHLFNNFEEVYKKVGIEKITGGQKIRSRKRRQVVEFIKINPSSTQREINKAIKTKVQIIFKRGIFEAYELACIPYPKERLNLHGTALNEIKYRAKAFEDDIASALSVFGIVRQSVKTKRGIADIILERKDKKIIIEIKDYQNKEISVSQVKQLNKYLEDINSDIGFLICHNKPKKHTFLIGKNQIFVLEKQELDKIPKLIGDIV